MIGPWHPQLPIIQDARYLQEAAIKGGKFIEVKGIMAKRLINREGALSTSNSLQYHLDIFHNAEEIYDYWKGDLTEEKRGALLHVFGYCARNLFEVDRKTFEQVFIYLQKLSNGRYFPKQPKSLRFLSMLLGYKTAEQMAYFYRNAKRIF